jgi:hypothetical protein
MITSAKAEAVFSPQSSASPPGYDDAMKVNLVQALSKRLGRGNRGAERNSSSLKKDRKGNITIKTRDTNKVNAIWPTAPWPVAIRKLQKLK